MVERKVADKRLKGKRVLGCALPRGKVFTIGESGKPKGKRDDWNSVSYALGEHAGRFLEVRRTYGDGIAQIASVSHAVFNLGDGSRRSFYTGAYAESLCGSGEGELSGSTPPVARLVLDIDGAFAVLYANPDAARADCYPNDGRALLVGYTEDDRITLDLAPVEDIPADSVRIVNGSTFTWTSAGQERSEP